MASAVSDRHVVLFPTPGMGHLIPLLEFANQLCSRHSFTATFVVPSDGPLPAAQSAFLNSLPPYINHIILPAVDLTDLPEDAKIEIRICVGVARSVPALRDALKSLIQSGNKVLAFIADLFGLDGFDAASEFGIPNYLFFPSTATVLSLFIHLPEIDKAVDCEFREMKDKLVIPGCTPIHGRDLLDPVQDRKSDAYKWVLHNCKKYRTAEGIIVNSFRDLEPGPIEALQNQKEGMPPVYAVGPLIRPKSETVQSLPCLNWLDEQPIGSVVFVSFGSAGTLSHDQIIELAHGLQISGHKFLWVIRCPSVSSASNEAYFRSHNSDDPLSYLPEGFVEATRDQGFFLPSWAPQTEILAQPSTAAFLTHCGWNSTLESVVNGIPTIAWPLFAEQRMNAVLLEENVKIALRPKVADNGLVERHEIAEVVKRLMQGEEGQALHRRARELKAAAESALRDGGASVVAIDKLARKWTEHSVE